MRARKPSLTARKIASDFLYMLEDAEVEALAPAGSREATRQLLYATGRWKPWMDRLIRSPRYRRLADWMAESLVPGQMLHVVLRKRFLDDEVRAALADGVSQVLVVGAGYDTLCLRLAPLFPEVVFVEIDHPATHRSKLEAVERLGRTRPNLVCLGADLGERSLPRVLGDSGRWDPDAVSAVVAEGVLMYLAESDVLHFLDAAREATATGSRLLVTYLHEVAPGRMDLGRVASILRVGLRLVGEPLRWIVAEDKLRELLPRAGFDPDPADRFDLARRYLEPAGHEARPLARLERVIAARKALPPVSTP